MLPSEKKVVREVLKMYKGLPVLWDRKHPKYTKQDARDRAFGLLLDKYRTLFTNASWGDLKKRLENMRFSHRKELKKVLESERRGDKPPYKSTLWYFGSLMFLETQVLDDSSVSVRLSDSEDDDDDDSKIRCRAYIQDKEILEEIIKTYREHPVMWYRGHPQYCKKEVRDKVLGLLLDKYRTAYPDATLMDVKKKIDNLRSNHRKERRKVLNALAQGREKTPKLWYYDTLMFVYGVPDEAALTLEPVTDPEDDDETSSRLPTNSSDKSPDESKGKKRRMIIQDQEVMEEVVRLYKEHPVLWDRGHPQYCARDVRNKALRALLVKYRTVYPDANVVELKKRLENLRSNRRRECKKVLKARARGEEYVPRVWYYEALKFLVQHPDDTAVSLEQGTDPDNYVDDSGSDQLEMTAEYVDVNEYLGELDDDKYEDDGDDQDEEDDQDVIITPKKRKPSTADEDNMTLRRSTDNNKKQPMLISSREATSLGKTVGLQLGPLGGFQRTVAEKLISDVIFYARLNKLSASSQLKLNADIYN